MADPVEFLDRIGLEHPVVQAGMGGRSALYAGETLHRIEQVVPAAEAVARLLP